VLAVILKKLQDFFQAEMEDEELEEQVLDQQNL
jgi:hypothetical protein